MADAISKEHVWELFRRHITPGEDEDDKPEQGTSKSESLGKGLEDIKPQIADARDAILAMEGRIEERKRRLVEQFAQIENLNMDTLLDFAKNVYLEKEYYLARDLYLKALDVEPDNQDAKFFLKRIEAHLGKEV